MNLTTTYKGESITLNKHLIASKSINKATVKKLLKTHRKRLKVLYMMRQWSEENKDFESGLKTMAEQITKLEFKLQRLWGFQENVNFHRFWELPYCKCPKLDNEDAWPYGYYYRNSECPIHGVEIK